MRIVSSYEDSGGSYSSEYEGITQMSFPLPNVVKETDRFGISDMETSALVIAVLVDFFVIKQSVPISLTRIYNKKGENQTQGMLKNKSEQSDKMNGMTLVWFDGNMDKTLIKKKGNKKSCIHMST